MPGGETLSILEIFVVLVAAATVVAIVARRTILPYSVGLVFLGLAVAALQPPLDLEIAPDVLLAVLIPGLIFEAAYRAEIDASPDPQAKMDEIEARLNRLRSPYRTAEPFWVEEVIDPRESRRLLCEFANMAAPLRIPGESRFTMRP